MGGFMKKGFGILEVLVAAVVLGFMIVGLNALQKGNRESIIRVRARDVANVIAQETIDSLSALGSASVQVVVDPQPIIKTRAFEGKVGNVEMPYEVLVNVTDALEQAVNNETDYTKALAAAGSTGGNANLKLERQFAKQVDITVSWKFKNSNQSINMSTVIK
jgi:type II secretory pathway pseudopilin PulG